MVAAIVFQEFLSVIRRQSENAIFPELRFAQPIDQLRQLLIHPTNSSVIERDDFVPVVAQTFPPNIRSIPGLI